MKKKRKKKKYWYIVIVISMIFGFEIALCYYDKVTITLNDNLTVAYQEKVTNLSFIKSVKNGKIVTKSKKIDTSKIGQQKINIIVKNRLHKKQNYSFNINIVDVQAPEITYQEVISTTEGNEIDLLKDVTAIDDVDSNINIKVVGEYDFNKEGSYQLYYVASDSSNNETKKEFTLNVTKKNINTTNNKTNTTANTNNSRKETTFKTKNGFQATTKEGITYIDGVLIANKTYSLPSDYGTGLTKDTDKAFSEMQSAAKEDGLNISIISGFRSYERQKTLYNNYVAKDGKEAADRYSARPGHSEHQTGLAVDINSLYTSFENTEEGKWLKNNSYQYGFILRYPKDKEQITGYMYEPWHFRYVGNELATKLYNNGNWITLEEYFGITSEC